MGARPSTFPVAVRPSYPGRCNRASTDRYRLGDWFRLSRGLFVTRGPSLPSQASVVHGPHTRLPVPHIRSYLATCNNVLFHGDALPCNVALRMHAGLYKLLSTPACEMGVRLFRCLSLSCSAGMDARHDALARLPAVHGTSTRSNRMHGLGFPPALPALQEATIARSAAVLHSLEPAAAHEVAQPAYRLTVGRGSNPLAALIIMPRPVAK